MTVKALAAIILIAAAPAMAHPKLLSATPAADSNVTAPARINLGFSEAMIPKMTSLSITMTAMPGMADHAPMTVKPIAISFGADGKSVEARLKAPLAAGGYRVDWRSVGADTHRVSGSYSFTVR